MKKALDRYRQPIQNGQIDPVRRWDGRSSLTLLDSADEAVPLLLTNLDAFLLTDQPQVLATGSREFVFLPIDGAWRIEVTVGGQTSGFADARTGGPFACWPGGCNAKAVYAPRNARVAISGRGEAIAFSGPAFADKPAALVESGTDRPLVSRGSSLWRRDVVTLATPEDVTTNLVVGETYSPPGLWSGTPLHVHDEQSPGQSDHEEIYYHLARQAGGPWGPFGVQMLFDDRGLDRAYVLHNRTAFAIPGGAHPVIAGPNSEMMYAWCLAAQSPQPLGMLDVPEFAWLKRVGSIIDRLAEQRGVSRLSRAEFDALAAEAHLSPDQAGVLAMHLRQLGYIVEASPVG